MDNRTLSLPVTSSPLDHNSSKFTLDEVNYNKPQPLNQSQRSQSEVSTSGLPSVHLKAQQQHRFMARKSVLRKLQKSQSLPLIKDNLSPDLIEVPFEDLIRRMDGTTPPNQASGQAFMSTIDESVINESSVTVSCVNGSGIDFAEDCLNDHEESYVTVDPVTRRDSESINRQLSDTLIIPDPFEREDEANGIDNNLNSLLV